MIRVMGIRVVAFDSDEWRLEFRGNNIELSGLPRFRLHHCQLTQTVSESFVSTAANIPRCPRKWMQSIVSHEELCLLQLDRVQFFMAEKGLITNLLFC